VEIAAGISSCVFGLLREVAAEKIVCLTAQLFWCDR
jgi:hypothetical protein